MLVAPVARMLTCDTSLFVQAQASVVFVRGFPLPETNTGCVQTYFWAITLTEFDALRENKVDVLMGRYLLIFTVYTLEQ
jgi:hypothetical protein